MLKWIKIPAQWCIYMNVRFMMYLQHKLSWNTATFIISNPKTYEVSFLSSTNYRSSYMCLMSGLETNKIYENGFKPRVEEKELRSFEEELVSQETKDDLTPEEVDEIFNYFMGSSDQSVALSGYSQVSPKTKFRPRDGFIKR